MTSPAGQPATPAGGSTTSGRQIYRWLAAGFGLLFLLLIAHHWHPVYHLTAFLQMAEDNGHPKLTALEKLPVFLHPGSAGYDGQYYAQLAYDPTITSPELPGAIDNIAYRGRRILAPSLAWLFAAGQPDWIIQTYSLLNVAAWLALAVIAWRLLRVSDFRAFIAWAGLLLSAGALHSVRFALTDLVALVFMAASLLALESHRPRLAIGLLALSGLGRETSLAAAPGLWNGPWLSPRTWMKNILITAALIAPFALWLLYLRHRFPDIAANPSIITVPGQGLLEKLQAALSAITRTNDPFLAWSTLLAVTAILVQAAYLLLRPKPQDPWWRAALPYVALILVVNHEVWEGDPGAITRVLLPLQLAFNLLASRYHAPLILLLAGNLSLFSGLAPFRTTNASPHELGHGRIENASVIARATSGWYATERSFSQTRTWSQATSRIELNAWPDTTHATAALTFKLRAFASGNITIRQDEKILWQGPFNSEKKSVYLNGVHIEHGCATLDFSSDSPAHPEGPSPSARQLAFALYDLSITTDRRP